MSSMKRKWNEVMVEPKLKTVDQLANEASISFLVVHNSIGVMIIRLSKKSAIETTLSLN